MRYGYRRDAPDPRDRRFGLSLAQRYMPEWMLPREAWNGGTLPAVQDQGPLGTCVMHAAAHAMRFNLLTNGEADYRPSLLDFYWRVRELEHTLGTDQGCQIRNAIKILARQGVGPDEAWPYDPLNVEVKPPEMPARRFRAIEYQRVDVSARALRTALYIGKPVIVGIEIFDSFEGADVARTGLVPMPGRKEKSAGGHCMLAIGYGQQPGFFTVRNSWGRDWGHAGNCYLPEEYLGSSKYGNDYWIINAGDDDA